MKKRILLADDDAAVSEMLGRVLESEQYDVVAAKTGRTAAMKFLADPPDLVLLDLNMPDTDGWEAFEMMNIAHPLVPIIVITAKPQQYEHAAELGVDGLMEKPLNLPLLLAAIADFLAESETDRMRRLTHPDFKTMLLNHNVEDRAT